MNDLTCYVYIYSPDIICLSDTWLCSEITDLIIRLELCNLFRNDRINSDGGEMLVFCKLTALYSTGIL